MKKSVLLLIWSILGWGTASGQALQVWPGDANNNGKVTNVDLLQIGMAYNNFGPARDSVNATWSSQSAQPWPQVLGNGVNAAYVDANGDGLIHYFYDAFPVYVHYGFSHGAVTPDLFPPATPGIDPPLFLDTATLPAQVFGGSVLELPLALGTPALPVADLYGLAFSMHFNPQFVDVDQVELNFNQYSWANPDNDRIFATYRASPERLDVAWVRTDHNERNGSGPIGTASIIIIDDVISWEQSFDIRIDSIQMIDRFGNTTAIAGDTLTIVVLPDAVTTDKEPRPRPWFRVWPNPAGPFLHLEAQDLIREARLLDAFGREAARIEPGARSFHWPLPALPPGMYGLEVRTDTALFRQKTVLR